MSRLGASIALLACLAGCVGETGAPAAVAPARGEQPDWEQQMERARHLAAAGNSYTLVSPDGVYTFYNDPHPFCYVYAIPGAWASASEPGLYRSKQGRGIAGVLFLLAVDLAGVEGASPVERAANAATREYERRLGRHLTGVELAPFESARPGTWRWKAAPVVEGGTSLEFPAKVFVELGPGAVAQITVEGTADDDALARLIVASLRTTTDPACYWSLLEEMLKAALPSG